YLVRGRRRRTAVRYSAGPGRAEGSDRRRAGSAEAAPGGADSKAGGASSRSCHTERRAGDSGSAAYVKRWRESAAGAILQPTGASLTMIPFIAKQDQLEQKIEEWRLAAGGKLQVEYIESYSGHKVYALTLSDFSVPRSDKKAVY